MRLMTRAGWRVRCGAVGAAGVMLLGGAEAFAQPARGDLVRELADTIGEAGDSMNNLPAPIDDRGFPSSDARQVELGKLLFYDKMLSGNQNISCATCHHGLTDAGDGLSLPVGEGGIGLGMTRQTGTIVERVPRNAPPIFNLGHESFREMFHDGRVEVDESQPSGYFTPAGDDLPAGLDSVLAAQAMFPVTSATEMAGQAGENPIADAGAAGDLPLVWEILAERLRANAEYRDLFIDAFDDIQSAADITYTHAANAIGAYEATAFRATDSPYDRFLHGDTGAMSLNQIRGMGIFYGKARCADCHSGVFQTDNAFHAIGMPQIGPGKGDNAPGFNDGLDDFGRERVTHDEADRYRFRTPTLRNVALTGPYGHDGAYNELEDVVRHHLRPFTYIETYLPRYAVLPSDPDLDPIDFEVQFTQARRRAIKQRIEILPHRLSDREVGYLLDFLNALTDPGSLDLRDTVPETVPSGLPVFD